MRSDLLTIRNVAEILVTSPDRVGDLIRAGHLQAIDIRSPGSRRATWRISQAALDDFLSRRTTVPATKAVRRRSKTYVPTYY